MFEMEIKARIKNVEDIKGKLDELGCKWNDLGEQTDIIFIKNTKNAFLEPIFRIRKSQDKILLTLKELKNDINTAKELEMPICDEKVMVDMLQLIGFIYYKTVKKKRLITVFEDFNICLDDVEGLGTFIEIEKLTDSDKYENVIYEKQKVILSVLGIKEENLIKAKYFQLL